MSTPNTMSTNLATQNEVLLEIESLNVEYSSPKGAVKAVRDVSLDIRRGETFGIAGESGSGKSTLALAILRYLGENGEITDGSIKFNDLQLNELSQKELLSVRGNEIAHAAQDAKKALNPSLTVGEQIRETVKRHRDFSDAEAKEHSLEMLQQVNIPDPNYHYGKYPHELSGGQQQRVVIAIALSCNPDLLILDEPTTGLDVTTQVKIIDLIEELKEKFNTSILLITHDLAIIAQITERVGIMYAGELMEVGETSEIFNQPANPYTQGLLGATPDIESNRDPRAIPGQVPSLTDIPEGCVFADRCEFATEECRQSPIELEQVDGGHETRCIRYEYVLENPLQAPSGQERGSEGSRGVELLTAKNLRKNFDEGTAIGQMINQGRFADYFDWDPPVKAVNDVDLTIHESETVGLVGESGCGKSTLGRMLLNLLNPTDGSVQFRGEPVSEFSQKEMQNFYSECQIVFQNPHSSLNPRKRVFKIIDKPLRLFTDMDEDERIERIEQLLEQVDLKPEYLSRYPHELSGGEKQRVAIARAFAPHPSLVVLDEPVSALDVSVKANIMDLLSDLVETYDTSYLFISHDLSVVSTICDRINVMYLGEIVETGTRDEIFQPPHHPYTRALLSSIPKLDTDVDTDPIRLEGDVPSPRHPPDGCSFHTRCPQKIGEVCETDCPSLRSISESDSHRVSCHLDTEEMSREARE